MEAAQTRAVGSVRLWNFPSLALGGRVAAENENISSLLSPPFPRGLARVPIGRKEISDDGGLERVSHRERFLSQHLRVSSSIGLLEEIVFVPRAINRDAFDNYQKRRDVFSVRTTRIGTRGVHDHRLPHTHTQKGISRTPTQSPLKIVARFHIA